MPKFENITAHYATNRSCFVVEIDGVTYIIKAEAIIDAIQIAKQAHMQN